MKYLKRFDTTEEYETFKNSEDYVEPNVSLCENDNVVYFNVEVWRPQTVDLGLPSGNLWATSNIGTENSWEIGLYFEFAGTEGYTPAQVGIDKNFSKNFADCKYTMGADRTFTKYCVSSSWGYNSFTDNLYTLLPEDDAATLLFGNNWSTPSPDDANELINNTSKIWTTMNGINGCLFTSTVSGYTDKSLFIPACGAASDKKVTNSQYMYISLNYTYPGQSYYRNILFGGSDYMPPYVGTAKRFVGYPIRPIKKLN